MVERLTLNLGPNLDWLEVNGLPGWIDEREYEFSTNLPALERFQDGDVLVWAQRHNTRFIFVGKLVGARVDRDAGTLRFERFEHLRRPVVICDDGVDKRDEFYGPEKGFYSDFSYISAEAFDRVMHHADRGADADPMVDARENRSFMEGRAAMSGNECEYEHRHWKPLASLPLDQGGIGRHRCAGCAYERGYEDGLARKETLALDLDSLPMSQAGSVRHRSPHAAYARGYYEGVQKSYEQ